MSKFEEMRKLAREVAQDQYKAMLACIDVADKAENPPLAPNERRCEISGYGVFEVAKIIGGVKLYNPREPHAVFTERIVADAFASSFGYVVSPVSLSGTVRIK